MIMFLEKEFDFHPYSSLYFLEAKEAQNSFWPLSFGFFLLFQYLLVAYDYIFSILVFD
jgi:hypothetical protein